MKIQETVSYNYSYKKPEGNVKIVKDEDKEAADVKDKTKKNDKDAEARAKEMKKQAFIEEQKRKAEEAMEQAESGKSAAMHLGVILTIFRRIARGDKVPPKDESALMEYDMKLYMAAKNAAQLAIRKKIKKYKKSLAKEFEEMEKEKQAKKAKEKEAEKTEASGSSDELESGEDFSEEDVSEEVQAPAEAVASTGTLGGNLDISV